MTHLKKGDKAPEFESFSYNGDKISLKDFIGQKVILFFYPKDNTPGCTAENCNLRDNYQLLKNKGFAIIGISADDDKSHEKFAKKFNLPFPLIPDKDKKIINSYNVWDKKTFMGKITEGINRTTFIIDENGFILHIFTKVDTANHAKQILDTLNI